MAEVNYEANAPARILVLGANGFIGSHLVDRFA